MEPHQLLSQLISEGGAIVCTGDCSVIEIADAQATGRMAVNGDGIGFIRRTKEWLALQKAREEAPVCACEFKFSLSQERCLRLAELEGRLKSVRIIHVIPLDDLIIHTADCQCCNAFIGDSGLRVHHSADKREQRERRGANGSPWGLYDEDGTTGLLVFIC